MKFLILALCVYAANGAVFKPWQPAKYEFKPVLTVSVVPAVKSVPVKPVYKTEYKPEVPIVPVVPAVKSSYVDAEVPIINYNNNYDPETQSSSYNFEAANGISVASNGYLKKVGAENVYAFDGSYKYISPEGITVQFTYLADENGYQPQSDLLPQGPPIPEQIARSLAYIASHPPAEAKKLY